MTWLDKRLKQRMVGALVLISLAVTFLPMLLNRETEQRQVRVDSPAMPSMPTVSNMPARPAQVPEAVATPAPTGKATSNKVPSGESHLDANGLPISWSIQLVSLSSRASADALVQKLRAQGHSAYIRVVDGMNRVYVGPLVERVEADRLRDQLQQQQQLKGFVMRFQPEKG